MVRSAANRSADASEREDSRFAAFWSRTLKLEKWVEYISIKVQYPQNSLPSFLQPPLRSHNPSNFKSTTLNLRPSTNTLSRQEKFQDYPRSLNLRQLITPFGKEPVSIIRSQFSSRSESKYSPFFFLRGKYSIWKRI